MVIAMMDFDADAKEVAAILRIDGEVQITLIRAALKIAYHNGVIDGLAQLKAIMKAIRRSLNKTIVH